MAVIEYCYLLECAWDTFFEEHGASIVRVEQIVLLKMLGLKSLPLISLQIT
jgi:hypothetical protein